MILLARVGTLLALAHSRRSGFVNRHGRYVKPPTKKESQREIS